MRTAELFCGTKSFSKVATVRGFRTFTVDLYPEFNPDVSADVRLWEPQPECHGVDVLWASPPCQAFSVASIGRNWGGGWRAYIPKTETARTGIALVLRTLEIIKEIKPKYWFIENPRGVLRKMPFMDEFLREQGGYGIRSHTANTVIPE